MRIALVIGTPARLCDLVPAGWTSAPGPATAPPRPRRPVRPRLDRREVEALLRAELLALATPVLRKS
jgi:hypothetical protein